MTSRRRRPLGSRLRNPECLEPRELLAGHGFGGAFQHFQPAFAAALHAGPVAGVSAFALANARGQAIASLGGDASEGHPTVLTATLVDSEGSATGTVKLTTYTEDDATETRLKVSVTGAAADSTLDVTIGETVVGQITTDADGAGQLILSSEPEDDEQPLPDDFPTDVVAGTAVSVGSLSGTLAVGGGHAGGCHSSDHTALNASLTDPDNSASAGTVAYHTKTRDGVTTTRFSVSVTGAAADSSLEVSIGDVVVGQVATDSTGAGTLVLSSDPADDESPLPANFPTSIAAGTTVTVGTLSGTFEETHAEHGFRARRFR